MRYFLLFVAVATCNVMTMARETVHPHFPNFRTVYHGHGATSYQNVQIDNYHNIPILKNYALHHTEKLGLGDEYLLGHRFAITPDEESHSYVDNLAIPEAVSYAKIAVDHGNLRPDVIPHYYSHQDHERDYQYHLRK